MLTTVKHLARGVGADERTLRRAVEQGTVRCSRVGPRRIEVAAVEEGYLREHWPLLRQLRGALRTEPNVLLAVLFGSATRGDARPGSDLDLLVALRHDTWDRRHRLNTRLERVTGRPVDLVVLERARRERPSLLAKALGDGRVLVDRGGLWPVLKSQERGILRAARADQARRVAESRAALQELIVA